MVQDHEDFALLHVDWAKFASELCGDMVQTEELLWKGGDELKIRGASTHLPVLSALKVAE
jgi:hypothetical protein